MKSFVAFLTFVCASILTTAVVVAQNVQFWNGLPLNPSILTLQRQGIAKRGPNSSSQISSSSVGSLPAGTGARLRAIITPSVSGNYTFSIAGSKNAALWLSTDDSRFHKQLVAWHFEYTSSLQWNKFASQQSSSLSLVANTSYYIEAQVMSSTAGGFLDLGWKVPGSSSIQSIPVTRLSSLAADSNDVNDNNLPDTWESQTLLSGSTLPGALSEFGDPDNDGILNVDEYLLSSDPLVKNHISNGLTRDTWSEIQGQPVSALTGARSRFHSFPTSVSHVANVNENSPNKIEGKNYGARYRGFVMAPVTGKYRFWIAGDDDAEFWFADGSVVLLGTNTPLTNRFGKQLLAHTHNPGGSYYTNYQDFDLLPTQRSREVHMQQGQLYYVEVLHKNESIASNHISLAWETPGGSRVVVPSNAFLSDIPDDGDKDGDFLPDSWESGKTLSTTDNGFTNAKEGQYGDFDADGLNNLTEFQLGTQPKVADSDGDTLTDGQEVLYYHTDPLVSNMIAKALAFNLDLANRSDSSVPWQTLSNGNILAYERCGWTDWTFTVAAGQEGFHEIQLTGGVEGGAVRTTENIPISFNLDGKEIGHLDMLCTLGQNTVAKQLTPHLAAGTHTLRIHNHNARADCNLRIASIKVYRLGGADLDSDGIADWAESKFLAENHLVQAPSSSLTSPVFIEGVAGSFPAVSLTRSVEGSDDEQVTVIKGVDSGFYANVNLDPNQATLISVSFSGDIEQDSRSVIWAATNIFEHGSMTIRQGDSLRLTGYDSSEGQSGTFTIQGIQQVPRAVDQPVVVTFATAGTQNLTVTWTPEGGTAQTASLVLTVASANFGNALDLQIYNRRTWTMPTVTGMRIEADSTLFWNETTQAGATSRSFLVNSYQAGTNRVVARLPDTGEIVAAGEIHSFSLARATETADSQVVEIRPDGSKVLRFTIVADNLPPNAEIRLHLNYSGTVFMDGSRDLILHASDFNSNGIATITVETSSDPPKLCHSMSAYLLD